MILCDTYIHKIVIVAKLLVEIETKFTIYPRNCAFWIQVWKICISNIVL